MDMTAMDVYLTQNEIHATKKTGNSITTVLGIIGGVIVIALLWAAWSRNNCHRHAHESERGKGDGYNLAKIQDLEYGYKTLAKNEREDAIAIAFNQGRESNEYYKKSPCGSSQFREVQKFKLESTECDKIEVCNS